ncbi:helix-turn-helix domain-containing protein [Actinoplanes teichomyceticus]|uniref:Excisionase family DNA binding protein n=1 Tax=Actinoplanes teichomyceticus TaxID=1867 RepID=A0A561WI80_ACTTI|nr:helix-turn-helix domain-containing protein [Actinoplanes teichomyceticus]TWG23587.1 excisionase family DNA binding protein [Actinoplanes teichomyceticus]GIF16214.1 hypothetical protein Ate01nite_62460 [Actinoplanes teichomyceticus]
MSRVPRPPAAYVHGLDGPTVVVPGRIAALLVKRARLDELRLTLRGIDGELDSVLEAIVLAGAAWRRHRTGSDHGTDLEKRPDHGSDSVLTTADAAALLSMSDRGVRRAITDGRLPAQRAGDVWLINREDVEHFRSARGNGESE